MTVKEAINTVQNMDIPVDVKKETINLLKDNDNRDIPLGRLGNIVFGQRIFDHGGVFGYNVSGGILDIHRIGVFPVLYVREAEPEDIVGLLTEFNNWRSFEVVNPTLRK